jgi:hypothetical protein
MSFSIKSRLQMGERTVSGMNSVTTRPAADAAAIVLDGQRDNLAATWTRAYVAVCWIFV